MWGDLFAVIAIREFMFNIHGHTQEEAFKAEQWPDEQDLSENLEEPSFTPNLRRGCPHLVPTPLHPSRTQQIRIGKM